MSQENKKENASLFEKTFKNTRQNLSRLVDLLSGNLKR